MTRRRSEEVTGHEQKGAGSTHIKASADVPDAASARGEQPTITLGERTVASNWSCEGALPMSMPRSTFKTSSLWPRPLDGHGYASCLKERKERCQLRRRRSRTMYQNCIV
jgi:hypothetical protein